MHSDAYIRVTNIVDSTQIGVYADRLLENANAAADNAEDGEQKLKAVAYLLQAKSALLSDKLEDARILVEKSRIVLQSSATRQSRRRTRRGNSNEDWLVFFDLYALNLVGCVYSRVTQASYEKYLTDTNGIVLIMNRCLKRWMLKKGSEG